MPGTDMTPLASVIERLERVAARLEGAGSVVPGLGAEAFAPAARGGGGMPALAKSYLDAVQTNLDTLKAAAAATGAEDVTKSTAFFLKTFDHLRDLLAMTASCKKPKDSDWAAILATTMAVGKEANQAADNRSAFFSNQKVVGESLNVTMLMTMPSPPEHIQGVLEAVDFHGNKVLQKKIATETAWMKAIKAVLLALKNWSNDNCKLGPTWSHAGMDPLEYIKAHPIGSGSHGGGGGSAAAPAPMAAAPAAAGGGGGSGIASSFDGFISTHIAPLTAAASAVGVAEVTKSTEFYTKTISIVRDLLAMTTACKKPKDSDWGTILAAGMAIGKEAGQAADNRNEFFSHQKVVVEMLNVVMIMTMPSPPDHVQGVIEAFDFHGNKVLQKKNPDQTAWVKALKASLMALKEWCTENCKMGPIWNANGQDPLAYLQANPIGSGAASEAKGKGKGAPAAAPPAGGVPPARGSLAGGAAGGIGAVLGSIAGGVDTGGLRKVQDHEKTKNIAGLSSTVKAKAVAPTKSTKAKGPAKMDEKGGNWFVENYVDTKPVKIEEANTRNAVYIANSENSVFQVTQKVKTVTIDNCKKCSVVVNSCISSVELVNCERMQVQMEDGAYVPSIAIDKCSGVQLFLSKESVEAKIVTSKSSEMNVSFYTDIIDEEGKADMGWVEVPIPEQFVSTVNLKTKKLNTEVSELYS